MDDPYDSPDSDGHGSIPSPNSTLNISALPRFDRSDLSPFVPADYSSDEEPLHSTPRRLGNRRSGNIPTPSQDGSIRRPRKVHSKQSAENIDPSEPPQATPRTDGDRSNTDTTPDITPFAEPSTSNRGFLGRSITELDTQSALQEVEDAERMLPNTSLPESSRADMYDSRTGLSRNIVVRKHRSSPIRAHPTPPPAPSEGTEDTDSVHNGSPTPEKRQRAYSLESYDGVSSVSSTEQRMEDTEEGGFKVRNVHFTDDDIKIMHDGFSAQNSRRVISTATVGTLENETLEEIDPHDIMRRLSTSTSGSRPTSSRSNGTTTSNGHNGDPQDKLVPEQGNLKVSGGEFSLESISEAAEGEQRSSATQTSAAGITAGQSTRSETAIPPPHKPQSSSKQQDDEPEIDTPFDSSGVEQSQTSSQQVPSPAGSSVLPTFPYNNFNLWKFKRSPVARRVSMRTPSSQSAWSTNGSEFLEGGLPSSLSGSEYQFPLTPVRYKDWNPATAPLEFSPILPPNGVIKQGRTDGTEAPPNSVIASPQAHFSMPRSDRLNRVRSQSDPVDNKPDQQGAVFEHRMLFTPTRLPKPQFRPDNIMSAAESDRAGSAASTIMDTSSEGTVVYGHRQNPSNACSFNQQPHLDSPSSLRLGDVHVRVQTPVSIDNNNSILAQSSPFRSNPENLSQHIQTGPEESIMLRQRVAQLEHIVDVMRRNEMSASDQRDNMVSHHETQIERTHERTYVESKEREQIYKTRQEYVRSSNDQTRGQEADKGGRDPSPPGSKLDSHIVSDLYAQIRLLQMTMEDLKTSYRIAVEEKDSTISHLKAALEQKQGQTSSSVQLQIKELQQKLHEAHQAHHADVEAREQKFANIIAERDAEVNHLQGELDDMANLMPVDQSSRLVPDHYEEGDSWMDDRSRELSQIFEESLDQIITELHGEYQGEDTDEIVAEAEMSLRRTAIMAGLPEDVDKATLAAFGIRKLREENNILRSMVEETEEREKQLMEANDELGNRQSELAATVSKLEKEKKDTESSILEWQPLITSTKEELQTIRAQLDDKTEALKQTVMEAERTKDTLEAQIKELEGANRASKESNQQTQRELDEAKSQISGQEEQIKAKDSEISSHRQELAKSKGLILKLEAELTAGNQTITDLQRKLGQTQSEFASFRTRLQSNSTRLEVLESENANLRYNITKTEADRKLARSRFDSLLHESAEHETELQSYKAAFNRLADTVDEEKGAVEGLNLENCARPRLIAAVLRWIKELEDKNARLKGAIKQWSSENSKEKGRLERLVKENKELALKLKAEKQQSDEKIGSLILALKR